MLEQLKDKIKQIPAMPGVYLLKDKYGRVIYVGKANSLCHRLRSYLTVNETISPRLRSLQARLSDIDYMVTDTEVEALILECNLIKEYRPRFNVNLKDDKDYPYLILTPELYPRLELLRLSQLSGKRGRYQVFPGREEKRFGPFTDVRAVRETMRFVGASFPLRRCRQALDGSPSPHRPCLNYQMARCLAPCRGRDNVTMERYNRIVSQVNLFLQGKYQELEGNLKIQMDQAAQDCRFEEAASLRDRLQALQRVAGQQQKMTLNNDDAERDILALGRYENRTAIHMFKIRGGKLLSQEHFTLSGAEEVEDEEVIASFIKSYYNQAESLPPQILTSNQPAEIELLKEWLKGKAGRKVELRIPRRGSLKKLVDLARRNCCLRLKDDTEQESRTIEQPLEELGRLIGNDSPPEMIEGFDISHLRGENPVGAMVVFRSGKPYKEGYRRFNVRTAEPGDDYGALQEVLKRRAGQENWPLPDFILIDGGRGQLSAARKALSGTKLEKVPLAALAKDPDRLFFEHTLLPLRLPANNPLLKFMQRIRDEVHRFAISGHRSKRLRSITHSRLEDIPGVGPSRRKALLNYFSNMDRMQKASLDQLAEVPGISRNLAEKIYQSLHLDNEVK